MMDIFNKIKDDLPNFPEEVIKMWLEPFAKEIGWPPEHARWSLILGEPLEFWQKTTWKKEKRNIRNLQFAQITIDMINSLYRAYVFSEENSYMRTLGQNGKQRYRSALAYFIENGIFPEPIVLLRRNKAYDVIDGSHRILAWYVTYWLQKDLERATESERRDFINKLRKKWNVVKISPLLLEQEVWIASQN